MQSQARKYGGWFARHRVLCATCRQRRSSRRSRPNERAESERAESERETFAGGRPYMTVSQCRVPLRKRRIWRRQAAAVRSSQREGSVWASVVATVVPVLGVVLGLLSLFCEAVAAAAAVAMPANASSSPQARIERRNAVPPWSIASRRPSGRESALGQHRSARRMRSVCRG